MPRKTKNRLQCDHDKKMDVRVVQNMIESILEAFLSLSRSMLLTISYSLLETSRAYFGAHLSGGFGSFP
jgi:hypothetical protein